MFKMSCHVGGFIFALQINSRIFYGFITSTNLFKQNWDGFGPEFVVDHSRYAKVPLQSANLHFFVKL